MSTRKTRWLLCKWIILQLEKSEAIEVATKDRSVICDEMDLVIKESVITDEDLKEIIYAQLDSRSDEIEQMNLSKEDAFSLQRKRWMEMHGDTTLHGFFFIQPIISVARKLIPYFMK